MLSGSVTSENILQSLCELSGFHCGDDDTIKWSGSECRSRQSKQKHLSLAKRLSVPFPLLININISFRYQYLTLFFHFLPKP